MPLGRRWRHVLGLFWAVLQFALPLAVSYADGRLASDGARAQPHAESDRSGNCPPVHSLECGLCRFLSNHSAAVVTPASFVDAGCASLGVAPDSPEFPRAAIGELPRSRGPPIA